MAFNFFCVVSKAAAKQHQASFHIQIIHKGRMQPCAHMNMQAHHFRSASHMQMMMKACWTAGIKKKASSLSNVHLGSVFLFPHAPIRSPSFALFHYFHSSGFPVAVTALQTPTSATVRIGKPFPVTGEGGGEGGQRSRKRR